MITCSVICQFSFKWAAAILETTVRFFTRFWNDAVSLQTEPPATDPASVIQDSTAGCITTVAVYTTDTCRRGERLISQLSLWVRVNFLWTPDGDAVPADEPSSYTVLWVGGPLHSQPHSDGGGAGGGAAAIVKDKEEDWGHSLSKLALRGVFMSITQLLLCSNQ